MVTGSEQESEAPAESGVDDDVVPPPKGHVEFNPAVVVETPKDIPNVKVSPFASHFQWGQNKCNYNKGMIFSLK